MSIFTSTSTLGTSAIPLTGIDGTGFLEESLYGYLREIEEHRAICERHEKTAAIHSRGSSLQLYRLFDRDEATARQIRSATDGLPDWTESLYWQKDGKSQRSWEKMQHEIEVRMPKRGQHPIITRGISLQGMPVLVHAYKFEPDPLMKVELVVAPYTSPVPVLPLNVIATLLACHECIVPKFIAEARPPYERHEAKFLTISEYLSRTMPTGLYATQCLQRVSCHASNGVGSRGTLREHHRVIASHSTHGQTKTP